MTSMKFKIRFLLNKIVKNEKITKHKLMESAFLTILSPSYASYLVGFKFEFIFMSLFLIIQ